MKIIIGEKEYDLENDWAWLAEEDHDYEIIFENIFEIHEYNLLKNSII